MNSNWIKYYEHELLKNHGFFEENGDDEETEEERFKKGSNPNERQNFFSNLIYAIYTYIQPRSGQLDAMTSNALKFAKMHGPIGSTKGGFITPGLKGPAKILGVGKSADSLRLLKRYALQSVLLLLATKIIKPSTQISGLVKSQDIKDDKTENKPEEDFGKNTKEVTESTILFENKRIKLNINIHNVILEDLSLINEDEYNEYIGALTKVGVNAGKRIFKKLGNVFSIGCFKRLTGNSPKTGALNISNILKNTSYKPLLHPTGGSNNEKKITAMISGLFNDLSLDQSLRKVMQIVNSNDISAKDNLKSMQNSISSVKFDQDFFNKLISIGSEYTDFNRR